MAPQQQQQSGGDDSFAPIWITILLFVTAYLLWYAAHGYVVAAMFSLNVLQAKLVALVLGEATLREEISIMQHVNPDDVTWGQMIALTTLVGNYMRYLFVAILGTLAVYLYRSNITLRFRKTYSMHTLREQEQANWSCIMPVVKQNDLVATDINTGPWAMALTPVEFARKHNLLRREDALLDDPTPGQEMTASTRRGDAKRIFTLQLGAYWDGFERCSPQLRALAAVFMARMCRDREAAQHILKVLDATSVQGTPDYAVALPTIKKYQNHELVQEVIQKHAYQLTVISGLLIGARDDGVVPSVEFLWLKPVDRKLWYLLNSIGRQTPYPEVGGIFAHLRAEQVMGRRSLTPMVEEAIKALDVAVKEVKLTPKEMQRLEP